MRKGGQTEGSGHEEDSEGSLSKRIARRGYSDMKGKATTMRDVGFGALTGKIGDKEANTYCRANREVRHDILAGQKIGDKIPLLGAPIDAEDETDEDAEIAALEAELKARKARKAKKPNKGRFQ